MSLGQYYDKISKEPLLTKEEEFDLFLEYQDEGVSDFRKDQIRDQIIRANLRFVFKEAKRYSKSDPGMFGELIAAGNEGLLVGMEKYKPQTGHRFLTYAGWWVKQRILEHMGSQRIVSLPIWKQQLATKIQRVLETHGNLSFDELKKHFPDVPGKVPEKVLLEMYQTRYLTFYIEDMSEDSSFEINPIEEEVEAQMDKSKLQSVVAELPNGIREVIELSFGLTDGEERKPSDIARELKMTREQVKNARLRGLELLKVAFGGENPFE